MGRWRARAIGARAVEVRQTKLAERGKTESGREALGVEQHARSSIDDEEAVKHLGRPLFERGGGCVSLNGCTHKHDSTPHRVLTDYLFPGYVYVFMDEVITFAAIFRPNELSAMAQESGANISDI